jgi:hypothetical protein
MLLASIRQHTRQAFGTTSSAPTPPVPPSPVARTQLGTSGAAIASAARTGVATAAPGAAAPASIPAVMQAAAAVQASPQLLRFAPPSVIRSITGAGAAAAATPLARTSSLPYAGLASPSDQPGTRQPMGTISTSAARSMAARPSGDAGIMLAPQQQQQQEDVQQQPEMLRRFLSGSG